MDMNITNSDINSDKNIDENIIEYICMQLISSQIQNIKLKSI